MAHGRRYYLEPLYGRIALQSFWLFVSVVGLIPLVVAVARVSGLMIQGTTSVAVLFWLTVMFQVLFSPLHIMCLRRVWFVDIDEQGFTLGRIFTKQRVAWRNVQSIHFYQGEGYAIESIMVDDQLLFLPPCAQLHAEIRQHGISQEQTCHRIFRSRSSLNAWLDPFHRAIEVRATERGLGIKTLTREYQIRWDEITDIAPNSTIVIKAGNRKAVLGAELTNTFALRTLVCQRSSPEIWNKPLPGIGNPDAKLDERC